MKNPVAYVYTTKIMKKKNGVFPTIFGLRSPVIQTQKTKRIWKKNKTCFIADEKSRGLRVHNENHEEKKWRIFDDFGSRSPVIQEKKKCLKALPSVVACMRRMHEMSECPFVFLFFFSKKRLGNPSPRTVFLSRALCPNTSLLMIARDTSHEVKELLHRHIYNVREQLYRDYSVRSILSFDKRSQYPRNGHKEG